MMMILCVATIVAVLMPASRLHDERTEFRVQGTEIDMAGLAEPCSAQAFAAACAGRCFPERRNGDRSRHRKAARQKLPAHRQTIIDGAIGKPCLTVAGAI